MKKYTIEDIDVYANGIVHCSVCVPEKMPKAEIERLVNVVNPSGITSPWAITEEVFVQGDPNPTRCDNNKKRLHYLLTC